MKHTEDKLDRGKFIKELGQLVRTSGATTLSEAHGAILLDGKYGTGKTFALKLLEMDLSGGDTKTVYFDAWLHEDVADPIVTISSSISRETDRWWRGKKLLTASACLAVDLADRYAPGTRDIVALVSSHEKIIKSFQVALEKLIASIAESSEPQDGNDHTKLVVLVDELDRCKPDFALRILERIKHFFSIRGVAFVVCMDMDSMKGMVKRAYGINDADGYLLKFFDYRLSLPPFDRQTFAEYLYLKKHKRNVSDSLTPAECDFISIFAFVAHVYNTSLRQMIRGIRETPDFDQFVTRPSPIRANHMPVLAFGLIMGLHAYDERFTKEVCGVQVPEFGGLERLLVDICGRVEAMNIEQKRAAARLLNLNIDGESGPDLITKAILRYLLIILSACFGCGNFRACITKESVLSRLVDVHISDLDAKHIIEASEDFARSPQIFSLASPMSRAYAHFQAHFPKPPHD